MTDMQLIVPPVEENENQGNEPGDAMGNGGNGKSDVLPDELKEHFEAMKSVWRQARRSSGDENEVEELRRKERAVAVKTAIAVDTEISRWQAGIAELEALLAAEDASDEVDESDDEEEELVEEGQIRGVVRFPSLPPVIPPEDTDSGSEGPGHQDDASETAATTALSSS